MNPLVLKLGPYVILGIMTFLYLGKRDDLAEAVEACNSSKLQAIAKAESVLRTTLQEAHRREIAQREALLRDANEARRIAEMVRSDAENEALAAQETIRALMRAANEDENAPISQLCLNQPVDPSILDGLR